MITFHTTIYARCAQTGEMKTFCGPNIKAPTQQLAHEYCQKNGLGYCNIEGELIAEIQADSDAKNDGTQNGNCFYDVHLN